MLQFVKSMVGTFICCPKHAGKKTQELFENAVEGYSQFTGSEAVQSCSMERKETFIIIPNLAIAIHFRDILFSCLAHPCIRQEVQTYLFTHQLSPSHPIAVSYFKTDVVFFFTQIYRA